MLTRTLVFLTFMVSLTYCFTYVSNRNVDGTGMGITGNLGKAADIFIRKDFPLFADNYSIPITRNSTWTARYLSNVFLAKDPIPGIEATETSKFTIQYLTTGEYPDSNRLNQLSVAFGQALIHDMTKVKQGFDTSLATHPDFVLPDTDHLCQIVVEVNQTSIYYFDCSATITTNADASKTVSITSGRYTIVHGTTYAYANGPFSMTVSSPSKVVPRKAIFPLSTPFVPDATNSSKVPTNDVTSFIDLSFVYGSNPTTSNLLRANDGTGKLLTAPDGNIPYAGQGIPNDCGLFDVATFATSASGDPRVDENVYLTFIHSLYFRNHNRDCDYLIANRPDLTTDEQRFQRARAINIARFQKQVYYEYLPAVFGIWDSLRYLKIYRGYVETEDPRVDVAFDLAFRVAHSQVLLPPALFNTQCAKVNISGTLGFPQHLRPNCMFDSFRNTGGVSVGKSAISQFSQQVNGKISDLMRNIVFRSGHNQNTAGFNLDIEMLHIVRSRTFGVPNYNTLRKNRLGKSVYELSGCTAGTTQDPLQCFQHVTNNNTLASELRRVYQKVKDIDAFIGLMLERDDRDVTFGQVTTAIILQQMKRSRDADPFFFLNFENPYLDFSQSEWSRIEESVADSIKVSYGFDVPNGAFYVPNTDEKYCTFA